MSMTTAGSTELRAEPLDAPFGALVHGWDPAAAPEAQPVAQLLELLDAHLVLVLRGHSQPSDEELAALARRFGPLFDGGEIFRVGAPTREILEVSNVPDGNGHEKGVAGSAMLPWHTDYAYLATAAQETFLNAVVLPPSGGGDTSFCDLYNAYETLPSKTKAAIADLDALHELRVSDQFLDEAEHRDVWAARSRRNPDLVYPGARVPARHPLVNRHPRSGRPALYVNSFISGFIDRRTETALPEAEAQALLWELFHHAVVPERIVRHAWQVGDLVIFDDVGTIHRRETFDHTEIRVMRQLSTMLPRPA